MISWKKVCPLPLSVATLICSSLEGSPEMINNVQKQSPADVL